MYSGCRCSAEGHVSELDNFNGNLSARGNTLLSTEGHIEHLIVTRKCIVGHCETHFDSSLICKGVEFNHCKTSGGGDGGGEVAVCRAAHNFEGVDIVLERNMSNMDLVIAADSCRKGEFFTRFDVIGAAY